MNKRSIGKTIATILLYLCSAFLIFGFIGQLMSAKEMAAYGINTYLTLDFVDAEKIGKEYEGESAREGYSFYCLTYEMSNKSSEMSNVDDLDVFYDYAVVAEQYEFYQRSENEEVFYYSRVPIVPGGMSAYVEEIVQVKDGTKEIEAFYCPNYEEKEEKLLIILPE